MNQVITTFQTYYDTAFNTIRHADGAVSLILRLILAPVLLAAGWEKLTGENWFAPELLPFPFSVIPVEISWFLAGWTEFLGGMFILIGLGTRLWAIPLSVTMLVAAGSVHWDNGWPAIAASNPDPMCVPDSMEYADGGAISRWVFCSNVNARTIEASERLSRAKSILREHGNYGYLNGSGSIVKLNNGIEFAMIYFAMLLALIMIGGGRYLSIDYYLDRFLRQ